MKEGAGRAQWTRALINRPGSALPAPNDAKRDDNLPRTPRTYLTIVSSLAAPACRLNDERVIRRVNQTRRHLLETVERPALPPLPAEPYILAEWRIRRGGIDHHVEVENHFYSVPHRYVRAEVDARLTARTVEVFLRGERTAVHRRGSGDGKHTTVPEHMPSSHRLYADWTIERIRRDADAIGPSVGILCALILERRPHPEQGFRACVGILRLARSVTAGRLDAAAARAIEIGALTPGMPPLLPRASARRAAE